MRNPGAGCGEEVDFLRGHEDRMGEPDIRPEPADGLCKTDRPHAVDIVAIDLLEQVFGQV